MIRNLDLTALRAFVTVAQTGGVTKAAGQLHLTQSAVSMQLKRLETALGQPLLVRSGRGVRMTSQGEQLLDYGHRILRLNDELWARMTDQKYEGEVVFGVPSDIVYPHVPGVLRRFSQEFPRVKVHLISSFTAKLKARMEAGNIDLIMTTEHGVDKGGETLLSTPLIWLGAPGGEVWQETPLRLAFEPDCMFRHATQAVLTEAGIPWDMVVDSDSTRTIEASISADLAIHTGLAGATSPYMDPIPHNGALPELPMFNINMYAANGATNAMAERLADFVRQAYGVATAVAAE